jgi:hypothetical protein
MDQIRVIIFLSGGCSNENIKNGNQGVSISEKYFLGA